jgi:hypothetical protein
MSVRRHFLEKVPERWAYAQLCLVACDRQFLQGESRAPGAPSSRRSFGWFDRGLGCILRRSGSSLLVESASHFMIGGAGIFLFGIQEFIQRLF